eukprot:PLAT13700.1.p1 GENE.PLAT13700.1~~PLAT13700.1.p1  ORF type:complete len:821 (-),score=427.14 PLAT13700.1:62-2524(-)
MVLIYEGIVMRVLDYDYAPASELVDRRRVYFNVSQEGKSDIDYLREEELINGLKLSSKNYQPQTCYQVSRKGKALLAAMGKADREAVHSLAYAPGTRELLRVQWATDAFELHAGDALLRTSMVTETEAVSYVSSAYVPQVLRKGGRPTLSNAHRAHECGDSSNIRDELDEVITLNSVSILVAEFIPMGSNLVVQLNRNLGSTERVQGGFFTALVDNDEGSTKFDMPPGMTSVTILDYSLTRHINFEADINFPEPPGIVQVETFGVHMDSNGSMFYGMQLEAVMNRIKDNISLDLLSRVLVDVHIDSSKIIDSVISAYQRSLLDLIYVGDAPHRNKVNLIIANVITPHLAADEYMDHGEYENELRQVLGDTRAAYDVSEYDTLIFGSHGLLLVGPNSRHHEPLLCSYVQFIAMDLFVVNFFNRLFLVSDEMKQLRALIESNEVDPNAIAAIRSMVAVTSKDIILLEEILGYLDEALASVELPLEPTEQHGRNLFEHLGIIALREELQSRVKDLFKTMAGTRHELEILRELSNVVAESRAFRVQQAIRQHTRSMAEMQEAGERQTTALEIMQVLLVGMLSFDVLDRITGDWSVIDTTWMAPFKESMIDGSPAAWFFISLLLWVVMAYAILRFMRHSTRVSRGTIALRLTVKKPISVIHLNRFLLTKDLHEEDRVVDSYNDIIRVTWSEKKKVDWGGTVPSVQIEYDERNAFLLSVTIHYNRRKGKKGLAFNAAELEKNLFRQFDAAGVFLLEEEDFRHRPRRHFGRDTMPDDFGDEPAAREEEEEEEGDHAGHDDDDHTGAAVADSGEDTAKVDAPAGAAGV